MQARDTTAISDSAPYVETFLALPAGEAAWDPTVAWDARHGRWVVAATSWEFDELTCDQGFLVLAVSSGADPGGAWTRWRVPIGANYGDGLTLGLSDDLLVLTTNEFPLDRGWVACLGLPFSGARVRAIDWVDVLDGGTLTVADLTPPSPRRYWSWRAARNVPAGDATEAGADVQLVVDRYDAGERRWGNVGHGAVSGGVVAGTVALVQADLTSGGIVPMLGGPPWMGASPGYMINHRLGEGGGLDEGPQGIARRGDRLMFTAASSCTPAGDTTVRTCLRVVTLDVSSQPTLVDDHVSSRYNQDTFFGSVGFARDGTGVLLLNRSTSIWGTWHAPGETMSASRAESWLDDADASLPPMWSTRTQVVADPDDGGLVWAAMPLANATGAKVGTYAAHGGRAGLPSGAASATPWASGSNASLALEPTSGSPITRILVSSTPTTAVGTDGQTWLSSAWSGVSSRTLRWDLSSTRYGGANEDGPRSVYVQWVTVDGVVSPVVETATAVDNTAPTVTGWRRFVAPSTLGSTAKVRFDWRGDDGIGSGVASYTVWSNNFVPKCMCALALPPLATTTTLALKTGLDYHVEVRATDALGRQSESTYLWAKPRVVQNTSSSIRYGGSWTTRSASSASGGSVRSTTSAGATAYITTRAVSAAIVVTKGPGRGKFAVYVDGALNATIDTYRSSAAYRQVVWQSGWTSQGTHTIKIRVLGTSGRPRVDLDAFLVLEDNFSG